VSSTTIDLMRSDSTNYLFAFLFGALALVESCGDSDKGNTPVLPESCATPYAFCAGFAYTFCVDVDGDPGRCVDWSRQGATPCAAGPMDCPTTLPKGSFPKGDPSIPIRLCVARDKLQKPDPGPFADAGPGEPGYCAAFQSSYDPAGQASCTPNPCGPTGHCSLIQLPNGNVAECIWPL
jgi:hypothetical protein